MGLVVTFTQAKVDMANAARLAAPSSQPKLEHLADTLRRAIDQLVSDGMGTHLDPFVNEIQNDLNSFGRTCN